jgi:hypothetical protein
MTTEMAMSDDSNLPDSIDERAARVLDRLGDDEAETMGAESEASAGSKESQTGDAAAAPTAAPDQGEGEEDAPPVSWTAEEKETFRKLPREARSVVARREAERERLISQRSQQMAQRERALDEQRRAYAQRLEGFIAESQAVDAFAGEDLAKLARDNPSGFAERVAALQRHAQAVAVARQERGRIAEENNRLHLAREFSQLGSKLPEFRDATQRRAMLHELGSYLAESGFSRDEIGSIVDHRTYLVALDAMRYRKLMKTQKDAAAKRVATASKIQRPGAANEGEGQEGRLAALKKAARRSGRLDDRAAYVLAALREE